MHTTMAFGLKVQVITVLVALYCSSLPVQSAASPDLTCLRDIENIIQSANAELEANSNTNAVGNDPITDGPFEFSLPGVIDISGNLAGVKIQGTQKKLISDFKFNSGTFELSFKVQHQKSRIDGEKYSITGSIGKFSVAGSGENFFVDAPQFVANIRVQFEINGFDCSRGNYQVKDLAIDLAIDGSAKINIPGLKVNDELVNWEKVNAILVNPGEHWSKSKEVVIKYMVTRLNQILTEFPIPPAVIEILLPEVLKNLPI